MVANPRNEFHLETMVEIHSLSVLGNRIRTRGVSERYEMGFATTAGPWVKLKPPGYGWSVPIWSKLFLTRSQKSDKCSGLLRSLKRNSVDLGEEGLRNCCWIDRKHVVWFNIETLSNVSGILAKGNWYTAYVHIMCTILAQQFGMIMPCKCLP